MKAFCLLPTALACLALSSCGDSESTSDSDSTTPEPNASTKGSPVPLASEPAPGKAPSDDPFANPNPSSNKVIQDPNQSDGRILETTVHQPKATDPNAKNHGEKQHPDNAPTWVKEHDGKPAPANARPVKFNTKFIEITHQAGAKNAPAETYFKYFEPADIDPFIRNLAQTKGVDIMTSPSISLRETEIGQTQIGQEFRYPVNSPDGEKFEQAFLGLNTYVRAAPADDGQSLDINFYAKSSEMTGMQEQADGSQVPIISTRAVDTSVVLTPGQSFIVGGLSVNDQVVVEDRTPILSDLPLIGDYFTNTTTEEYTRELIILVTPELLPNE